MPEQEENITFLNIYQKLARIRDICDVAQKNLKGYGYKYEDITEIIAKVTAGMKKYNVSLIPQIVPGTSSVIQNVVVNTKSDKTGRVYDSTSTEMLFCADMIFTWVNDDVPEERIDVPWFTTGAQSDPSQAFGTGLTYTNRQFLTSYFQIAKVDEGTDVEQYRKKQKEALDAENVSTATAIIDEFDTICKVFLSDNKDKNDDVKEFISRFVKDSNYKKIKDPILAAKLMKDFKEKFLNEEEA